MGVLDFLDSPNLIGNLLGIGTAEAAPGPTPSPTPVPPQGAMGPPQEPFSPTSTMGTMATLGGGGGQPTAPLSFNDRAQPAQDAVANGTWDPQMRNYTKFMPQPPNGGLQMANDTPFRGGPAADPEMMALAYGGDTRVASADPRFAPSNLPPIMRGNGPPMPPPMAGGGPPTMNQGGGLMSALGLGNQDRQSQFIAGLGKGAAGATGPGGLAAAMRGFGGGVSGSQEKGVEQDKTARQEHKEAFEEDLKTKTYDIAKLNAAIRQRQQEMQEPFWKARAEVLRLKQAQDRSRQAWELSEPGQYATVNREVKDFREGLRKDYTNDVKDASDEKKEAIRKMRDDRVERFRDQRLRERGLDPAKADAVMKRGFVPPAGMTPEQSEEIIKHLPAGTMVYNPKTGKSAPRKLDQWNAEIGADTAATAAQPPPVQQQTEGE